MMENKLILITGGARSGKSTFAEDIAKKACTAGVSDSIAYIATGMNTDEEFKERIEIHKKRRSEYFVTYEESIEPFAVINNIKRQHKIFIIECLTTWLGNLYMKYKEKEIPHFIDSYIDDFIKVFAKDKNDIDEYSMVGHYIESEENGFSSKLNSIFNKNNNIYIIVANELGMGLVPPDPMSRMYRDTHGRMLRKFSTAADFVFFTVSGVPCRIK
jgi:adenosylcobinamide kinase/adenosylcobinamide-phosphate guanylyltransferase